jgi:alkylation response protein AidB-like acyl-CoA dehydrogenase
VAQAVNRYKADLREIQFVLFEQLKLQELLGKAPFENWGIDDVKMVVPEVYRFACEVSGPLNAVGDQEGCKLIDGNVKTPSGFREAFKRLCEAGWNVLSAEAEYGGQGAPRTLGSVVTELISGSNTSFQMYGGLTLGAAELIASFGTEDQKHLFCEKMLSGEYAGTMCLTEPHAGSDVGDCSTSAVKNSDGTYNIKGVKIFISGGDHDLTHNIVHMVLARVEGAPKGTKGLSLFIVPKHWVNADGSTKPNDVITASIEHKMGIAGSSTCVLNFGESDACRGYLCGTVENQGIAQMFQMMNGARILVGVQGLAVASSAYLNALEYAKDRKQGSSLKSLKDPNAPRVPIIQHPDVRRMLLDMKSRVEGMRLLGLSLTMHLDRADALKESDPEKAAYHKGQVDLLVPLFKAYGTDQGFQVAATAIQTYGGAGFLKDHPAEQYCRDAKIFSIYEGTNHIQAMDLVGRKLRQQGGKPALDFLSDIQRFVEKNANSPKLKKGIEELREAHESMGKVLTVLMKWGGAGALELTALAANRVLEAMSELSVAWLLLEGAVIAEAKLGEVAAGKPDHAFYTGKIHAALYYALNVLPGVGYKADLLSREDSSPMDIPEEAFATL